MRSARPAAIALGLCLALAARAEGEAPADEAVGLVGSSSLGWSDQVKGEGHATFHVAAELLARAGPIRAALVGRAGLVGGDYWTTSLEVGAGPTWRVGSALRLEVVPTVGLVRFGHVSRSEEGTLLPFVPPTRQSWWGGAITVPAAGLRLGIGLAGRVPIQVGVVAQQTLRTAHTTFIRETCTGPGYATCERAALPVTYGGLAVGLQVAVGLTAAPPR